MGTWRTLVFSGGVSYHNKPVHRARERGENSPAPVEAEAARRAHELE